MHQVVEMVLILIQVVVLVCFFQFFFFFNLILNHKNIDFYWFTFEKKVCPNSCLTCYGGNDNQCLSCPNEKVLESGSCLPNCSNGNYPDSNHICQGFCFSFSFLFICHCVPSH